MEADDSSAQASATPTTPSRISTHLAKYAFVSPRQSIGPFTSKNECSRVTRSCSTPGTPAKRARREGNDTNVSITPEKEQPLPLQKAKYAKKPRPYASPEVYKHLRPLNDHLGAGLDVVFCGINPGKQSAISGHHYANPTNRFWKCLHESEFTDRLISPTEDFTLPEMYNIGLTNLVERPTSEQAELSTLEMRQSVPALLAKLKKHRPRVLCFVGKKIWDEFEAVISKSVQRPAQADTKTDEPKVKVEADQADVGTSGSRQNSQAPTPRRQTFAADAVQMYALDPEGKLVAGSGLDTIGTSPSGPVTPVKKPTTPKPTKISRTPKTPKVAAAPWRWDEPRPYRYVYPPSEDKPVSTGPCACYFWVVPSTSGLERTLIADKIMHFQYVRRFSKQLEDGLIEADKFQNISDEGVAQTIEAFEIAAAKRAARALSTDDGLRC